jgi:hypothetical protein
MTGMKGMMWVGMGIGVSEKSRIGRIRMGRMLRRWEMVPVQEMQVVKMKV